MICAGIICMQCLTEQATWILTMMDPNRMVKILATGRMSRWGRIMEITDSNRMVGISATGRTSRWDGIMAMIILNKMMVAAAISIMTTGAESPVRVRLSRI